MENYYSILEISESATPEEITQAYRLLLQVWHPDRFHHSPTLLKKAERKSREINAAFDTLSNPELKQRYDDGLRAGGVRQERHKRKPSGDEARITRCPDSVCNSVLRVDARTVVIVTCPTCRTTFRYDPERNEKWDITPPEKDEFFTPARMAMLAIAILFAVVLVFTTTKKSKIIVSNKPAHTDEQARLPRNAPLVVEEEHDHDHHAVAVRDDVSNTPTQTDKQATLPRNASTADTQQERLNGLDVMQRQMAQAARRAPAPQAEMISEVDLQQLKTLAAQGNAWAQAQLALL